MVKVLCYGHNDYKFDSYTRYMYTYKVVYIWGCSLEVKLRFCISLSRVQVLISPCLLSWIENTIFYIIGL